MLVRSPPRKPGDLHAHLFALETRREAEEHDDGVGLLGHLFGLAGKRLVRRRPEKLQARFAVRLLADHANLVVVAALELHRLRLLEARIRDTRRRASDRTSA